MTLSPGDPPLASPFEPDIDQRPHRRSRQATLIGTVDAGATRRTGHPANADRGRVSSKSGVRVAAGGAIIVLAFSILLAAFGFSGRWEAGFTTAAASISLVMLFVIQHTQNRIQVASQLKLDELIRTSPRADDLLVHIETAKDEELIEREQNHIAHHESLREASDDVQDEPPTQQ